MIQKMFKALAMAALVAGPVAVWAADSPVAVVELSPTQGNTTHGEVKFFQKDGYVLVTAHVEGLTPGKHPFHVHVKADCSAPDASSAGGHYNPDATPLPAGSTAKPVEEADLGKLNANSQGVADYKAKKKLIHLSGDNSIIGHSVVVHASDSPARVACGVVQAWTNNQ